MESFISMAKQYHVPDTDPSDEKTQETTHQYPCLSDLTFLVLVTQLCQTLCDPMDYSLPGPSIHAVLQAGVLE